MAFTTLLTPATAQFIKKKVIESDINIVLIYGNQDKYRDRLFTEIIGTTCTFFIHEDQEIGKYRVSKHHIEFDFTPKAIQFIKDRFSMQNTIDKRSVIIHIKNIDMYPQYQSQLKTLIEKYYKIKFILSSESLSGVHFSLRNMCLCLNTTFTKQGLYAYLKKAKIVNNSIAFKSLYTTYGRNLDLYLHDKGCDKIIETKYINDILQLSVSNEKSQYHLLKNIRNMAITFTDNNINLSLLCRLLIKQANKNLHEIIKTSAECEHHIKCCSCRLDKIIMFEKFMLEIYKINKSSYF